MRDPDDGGIQFVEANRIAGAAIGGERSRAKTDDADPHRTVFLLLGNRKPDAGGARVVAARLQLVGRVGQLLAMQDHAM